MAVKTRRKRGKPDWAKGVIAGLADGLTAYMTLQARTGLSPAYSEYLLYDPVVRISRNQGWIPLGEYVVETKKRKGDYRRFDFMLVHRKRKRRAIAIEIKWVTSPYKTVQADRDVKKLISYKPKSGQSDPRRFLMLAGAHKVGPKGKDADPSWPKVNPELTQGPFYHTLYRGQRTRYGVTVFEILPCSI